MSDFTPSVRDAIVLKVASELRVSSSAVTLLVSAASVRLSITVALPSASAAESAVGTLATRLSTPEAASVFVSTPALAVVVTTIDQVPAAAAAVPALTNGSSTEGLTGSGSDATSPGTTTPNSNTMMFLIIGAAVSCVLVLACVGSLMYAILYHTSSYILTILHPIS